MIQILTIICQALTVCALAVNFYYLRQLQKERRRAQQLLEAATSPHKRPA